MLDLHPVQNILCRSRWLTGIILVLALLIHVEFVNGQATPQSEQPGSPVFEDGILQPDAAKISLGTFNLSRTGAATYTVPIMVAPGTAGLQPELALTYSSQAGNGLIGVGWRLTGLSAIARCRQTIAQDAQNTAIEYSDSDRFCLGGQKLVTNGAYGADGTQYRTEKDTFVKVTSHGTAGTGPAYFTVRTKDGRTLEYGNSPGSRIEGLDAQENPKSEARAWALNSVRDTSGNEITISYVEDSGDFRPDMIEYGGRRVEFEYDDGMSRPDIPKRFVGGGAIEMRYMLTKISTFAGADPSSLVREYILTPDDTSPTLTGRSRLKTIQECGVDGECYTAFDFGWTQTETNPGRFLPKNFTSSLGTALWNGDFNGDGRVDYVKQSGTQFTAYLSECDAACTNVYNEDDQWGDADEWDDAKVWRGDFNGDGLTDILTHQNGFFYTYRSDGTKFVKDTDVTSTIINPADPSFAWTGDFNGDGRSDIVSVQGTTIYTHFSLGNGKFTADDSWDRSGIQTAKWSGNSKFFWVGDVNGDRMADLVSFKEDKLHVYRSHGNGDYSYSATAVQNSDWSKRFAWIGDYNGDGLMDLLSKEDEGDTFNTYFSRGDGSFDIQTYNITQEAQGATPWSKKDVWVGDFNGDGMTDLMSYKSGVFHKYFSKGNGEYLYLGSESAPGFNKDAAWTGDVNGDGLMDVVSDETVSVTYLTRDPFPDLIESIATPLGAVYSITYAPLSDQDVYTKYTDAVYPQVDVALPLRVVSSHTVDTGCSGDCGKTYFYSYTYEGLKSNLEGRGNLGFARVDQLDETGTDGLHVTFYEQDFPFEGMVASTEVYDADFATNPPALTLIQRVINDWHAPLSFPELQGVELQECEGDGNCRVTSRSMEYDDNGNLEKISYEGTLDAGDEYEETTEWQVVDTADTWLHRPIVKAVNGFDGTQLQRTFFYYDGNNTSLGTIGTRGLQTAVEFDLGGGAGDGANPKTVIVYDAFGNRQSVTDPVGCTTSWEYDDTHTFPDVETTCLAANGESVSVFDWDERWGEKESAIDPNGHETIFEYDDLGRLLEVDLPHPSDSPPPVVFAELRYLYDLDGGSTQDVKTKRARLHATLPTFSKSQQIDGLGRVWKEGWATATAGTLTADTSRVFHRDARGRVTEVSAPYASFVETPQLTTFIYDALGRIIEVQKPHDPAQPGGPALVVISSRYFPDPSSNLMVVEITDERGNRKRRYLDAYGHIVKLQEENEGDTYTTLYTYNALGQLLTTTNHVGHVASVGYDKLGRKTWHMDPDAGRTEYTQYDKNGNILAQTDAKGQVITFQYDLAGRLRRKTYEGADSSKSAFKPTSHFPLDEGSGSTVYETTGTGNTGVLGGTYQWRSGSDCVSGNCIWMDGQTGYSLINGSPSFGSAYEDFSISVRFKPDSSGQMQVLTRDGNVWYRIYRHANGSVVGGFYYAPNGHWKTGNGGHCPSDQWCHVILSFDRDSTMNLYVNGSLAYQVDITPEAGVDFSSTEVLQIATGMGPGTKFHGTIDELKFYSAAITPAQETAQSIQWTYDDPSMSNSRGRVTRVEDLAGSVEFHYDRLGRPIQIDRVVGNAPPYTVEQTYNPFNKLATKTFPDGDIFRYYYDVQGRLFSIENDFDYDIVRTVRYTKRGQIWRLTYGNFKISERQYGERAFRLEALGLLTNEQDLEYRYDEKGNVTDIIDSVGAGTAARSYTYDDLDRLKTATGDFAPGHQPASETYQYDAVGNILLKGNVEYFYNDGNNQVIRTELGGSIQKAFEYDANGNMTENGGTTYTWDQDNRLTSAGNATFQYDYAGRRVAKDSNVYPFPDYEVDTITGVARKHFHVNGELVAVKEGGPSTGSYRYYHTDHLGSVHLVTDESGTVVQNLEYDPWGKVSYQSTPGGATKRFTGQESDEETGLYYYVGRYYDPELGRFTRPDPFVGRPFNPQSLNRYSYVRNNPANRTDPSGYTAEGESDSFLQTVGEILWTPIESAVSWIGNILGGGGGSNSNSGPGDTIEMGPMDILFQIENARLQGQQELVHGIAELVLAKIIMDVKHDLAIARIAADPREAWRSFAKDQRVELLALYDLAKERNARLVLTVGFGHHLALVLGVSVDPDGLLRGEVLAGYGHGVFAGAGSAHAEWMVGGEVHNFRFVEVFVGYGLGGLGGGTWTASASHTGAAVKPGVTFPAGGVLVAVGSAYSTDPFMSIWELSQ